MTEAHRIFNKNNTCNVLSCIYICVIGIREFKHILLNIDQCNNCEGKSNCVQKMTYPSNASVCVDALDARTHDQRESHTLIN